MRRRNAACTQLALRPVWCAHIHANVTRGIALGSVRFPPAHIHQTEHVTHDANTTHGGKRTKPGAMRHVCVDWVVFAWIWVGGKERSGEQGCRS